MMVIEQKVLLIIIILGILLSWYFRDIFQEKFSDWAKGGVIDVGNRAYPTQVPTVPRKGPWQDETQAYFQSFFEWVNQQRVQSAFRRKDLKAPNGSEWAPPKRFPHGVLDRTFQFDLNDVAKRYWNQATKEAGGIPGEGIEQGLEWSPFIRSFDWLKAESAWISDTNPISDWKLVGIEGFVQDRMHYVTYRVWLVMVLRVGQPLTAEPVTNEPGTYYIGYPTPEQAARRIGFPLPTDVIVTSGEVIRERKPENPEFLEMRLWGLWILDSTLTLATHPVYTKSGIPPNVQFPWPSAGWADSSLDSSTPPRKVLEESTPWGEPAVLANQWIPPQGIPNDEKPFPCGQIPSWVWDDWGISPPVAPKELSCPWQTYALRSLPLRPSDNPTKGQLPRDVGEYTWLFDPPSGMTQFPHAVSN